MKNTGFNSQLIFIINIIQIYAGTVFITNSPSQIDRSTDVFQSKTTSYDLEVPGSDPIRIIESDHNWNLHDKREDNFTGSIRRTKDFDVAGSDFEQDRDSTTKSFKSTSTNPFEKDTKRKLYSPRFLEQFLQQYAEKIKNADDTTKSRLEDFESRLKKYDNDRSKNPVEEKSGYLWDILDIHKHNVPIPDDKHDWVTLEAVPWSTSKISKWQPKPSDYPSGHYKPRPQYLDSIGQFSESSQQEHPRPIKVTVARPDFPNKPAFGIVNNRPDDDDDDNYPSYYTRPYEYQKPDYPEYSSVAPTRPWHYGKPTEKPIYNNPWYYDKPIPKPPCDDKKYDDIVTDGGPSNFPPYREPTPVVYAGLSLPDSHPSSHPSTGNGDWVLISTTKGYQTPRSGQRSMNLSPDPLKSTQAIKLTVLPPEDVNNMTTSHGGILEVQSTLQTVDESQKLFVKEQQKNITKPKVKKTKPLRPHRFIQVKNGATHGESHDSSAVLAAVGAGMLPATMAMVMPMLLGRKKRSIISGAREGKNINLLHINVTQMPGSYDYESVIPRSLAFT